jgi:hypothetical protein
MAEPIDWAIEHLKQSRQYNIDNGCLPSQTRIIERMLKDGAEIPRVYRDIAAQVEAPIHRKVVLEQIVTTLAFHGPSDIDDARYRAGRVRDLNLQISSLFEQLSELYRRRDAISEDITTPDDKSPYSWILEGIDYEEDASTRHRFNAYVKPQLEPIVYQYYGDYPSAEAIFRMLAERQVQSLPEHVSSPMVAAFDSRSGKVGHNPAVILALFKCQFELIGT